MVYSISEIKDILGVSRTKAYEYIKKVYEEKKPFVSSKSEGIIEL